MTSNDDLIRKIAHHKKISKSTLNTDLFSLNLYSEFQGLSLEELIDEADEDEENISKLRKRKIKDRLNNFVEYLEYDDHKHKYKPGTGFTASSIKTIVARVKAFYSYHEIQLPKVYLPKILNNETTADIPTLQEIKKVIDNEGNIKHRALIKFMLSSGLSATDTSKLTKEQFYTATYEYHNKKNPKEALEKLNSLIESGEPIIPTWELTRTKTNYSFITFNSPEATKDIVMFLMEKSKDSDERLFEFSLVSIKDMYLRLNKRNKLGKTSDGHNRFHAHAMRKIFATTLTGAEINGAPLDTLFIEFLLGHKLPGSREPYYKNRPKRLKKIYLKIVDELSIENINVIDLKSPEYLELKRQKEELEENLESIVKESIENTLMKNGLL